MGIALLAVGGVLVMMIYIALLTAAMGRATPDPVVNLAYCISCGAPTFQSIADDLNCKPPLCSACTPAEEDA